MDIQSHLIQPAVVSRPGPGAADDYQYLRLAQDGAAGWTDDPLAATAFESMREAARAALRLPSAARAFGMPLRTEVSAVLKH